MKPRKETRMLNFFGSDSKAVKKLKEENERLKGIVSTTDKRLDAEVTAHEKLKLKLGNLSNSKRIEKLQKVVDRIPDGTRGEGSILVYKDDDYESIKIESKSDLQDVIDDAQDGKLELVFV